MASKLITGLTLRRGIAEWTVVDPSRGGGAVLSAGRADLALPEGADPLDPALSKEHRDATAAELKAKCGGVKGTVAVAIPSQHLFLRVLSLPVVGPDELASMVELQVDKFAPFPIDRMVISHEILEERDARYRVLVAGVKRELVDGIGEMFRGTGMRLERVDAEGLGWWRLLRDAGAVAEKGRQIILVLDVAGEHLVVAHNGVPVAVRSLGAGAEDEPDEERETEIVSEISYTLTALEAEAEAGEREAAAASLWHWGDAPDGLIARIREECALEVVPRALDALPAPSQGIALRAADAEHTVLNLAPPAWERARQTRRGRRRLIGASAAALFVWLLGVGAIFGGVHYERTRLADVKKRLDTVLKPAEEAKAIRERIRELESYAGEHDSPLECLREICDGRQPIGVDLTEFVYTRGVRVDLVGVATDDNLYSQFYKQLNDSTLFRVERASNMPRRTKDGRRVLEFRVTLLLAGETEAR
ncbi:MAG: hypothetical protein JXR37_25890 [Kiritimatiellae bacterium]|nr:hypothetical protein [Kiritimatiellia bacterium]